MKSDQLSARPAVSADSVAPPVPMNPPPVRQDRVWIAWEKQRRSLSLSGKVRAKLFLCLIDSKSWRRYPVSIAQTVRELSRRRGQTVFVQNPSMVLAALACFLKKPLGYALVVDRHSNFGFLSGQTTGFKAGVAEWLSRYSLRRADMTIVTNEELAGYVRSVGGSPFVLPDPFPEPPEMAAGEPKRTGAPKEILFAASWADDEPIAATIEACRRLGKDVIVRITGRMKKKYADVAAAAPENFIQTGFVSDAEYFALMARCDAVMAVSVRPMTLVCAGYEGTRLGKPLILGDSAALQEFFSSGAVYTDGSASDLETKIRALFADLPKYQQDIRRLYEQRAPEWDERLARLEETLATLGSRKGRANHGRA